MKRFHVHVSVEDIATSVGFYSAMFDATPTATEQPVAANSCCRA